MNYEIYFPRGIATKDAFCNRIEERKRIIRNIKTGQHTLLLSPRRYGKTSLVKYAVNELKIPFGEADLFIAVDAKRIEQRILAGVKEVMRNVSSSLEQVLETVRAYFRSIQARWVVGTKGISIALIPDEHTDPATNIMEALSALENLLSKKKQHAVLFLDEVQEMSEVAGGRGIEGAIRHVAQKTRYLTIIFSGSHRHLLANMFYDKARPLYKLCDRIALDRIEATDYIKHLNKLARKRWSKDLDKTSFNTIFELTELHPFYVNILCLRLWESDIKNPSSDHIKIQWHEIVKEERLEIMRELSILSPGQRRILILIAQGFVKSLTGKTFLKKIDMASSSVVEALRLLENGDYIEKKLKGEYYFIDPLVKTALQDYFAEN